MAYSGDDFDSPGVEVALAQVKVKEAGDALGRATERALVIDREEVAAWHRTVVDAAGASDALALLAERMEGFLAT